MKILLLGKNGQVGWELQRTLAPLGNIIALGRENLDLTDLDDVSKTIREIKPDIIVNAAAYTVVDKAEEEPELAMIINGVLPGILAEEVKRCGGAIIHYSTDYVFDGEKESPYTEEDRPNPINVYGKTKLAGEQYIQQAGAVYLILRTSWVYSLRGKNFLLTMLKLMRDHKEIRVIDDQFGIPTWSRMIAEATAQLLAKGYENLTEKSGLYNLTAGGYTSWYGFANAITSSIPEPRVRGTRLIPVPTDQYFTPASRPANSRLSNAKLNQLFGLIMPDWYSTLKMAIEEINN